MHNVVRQLAKISSRYAPSRLLSYEMSHVFRSMQLMAEYGRISRNMLASELNLGDGSVKTLVKHLKMNEIVETSNAGMWLTRKGETLYNKIYDAIPHELSLGKCPLGLGKFNHAVLVKDLGGEIGTGIEQRDAAIKLGAKGATTLVYENKKFLMPDRTQDSLRNESEIKNILLENLQPDENDVIIIASSDNKKNANLAAKSAAILTISNHEKHW